MKRLFYYYFFAGLLSIIQFLNANSQILYNVQLADNLNNKGNVKLSSIVNDIKYIPLETTPDCMLGNSLLINLTEKFIFVFDFKNVYRFDRSGKFINKIGNQGKGPGEYVRLINFTINPSIKEVYLLDAMSKKILAFNYNGNLRKSLKIKYFGQFFSLINDDYIIHNNSNYYHFVGNKPTYELEIIDLEGKKINRFESTIDRNKKYGLLLYFPHFCQFKSITYYKNPLNDTVYQFSDPYIRKPYAIINTGKYKRKEGHSDFRDGKYIQDKLSIIVTDVKETNKNLFITCGKGREVYRALYNKGKNEVIISQTKWNNRIEVVTEKYLYLYSTGLINDIDGGLPFWPRKIQNDTLLIDYRHAYELMLLDDNWFKGRDVKDKYKLQELKALTGNLKDTDNPVIIVGELK